MAILNFLSLLLLTAGYSQAQTECLSRDYDLGGTVCVCNSEQCDTIPRPEKLEQPQFLIYTSNKAGLRFKQETGEFVPSDNSSVQIIINSEEKYQTILGWGGAFTDATGINIASLEEDLQDVLLRSYFSEDGLEYSLCRVPIGGTDFSTHGYSYDDGDVDEDLVNFALAEEDHTYKIPYMKKALELTNNSLRFFGSAWAAPKWMKTNGEYAGAGSLIEEFYQTWADYFVKFLDHYLDESITFWGLTTGNEPFTAMDGIGIPAVGWNATEMGKWIINNLGPAITVSNHSDIILMLLDDNRNHLPGFIDTALEESTAADYIDGIAVHWYTNSWTPATVLSETHDHFPEKFILNTEACNTGSVVLGAWDRGEKYSADIIEDLYNWVTGWIDWNMVLDLSGGPTYIDNFVDSPIIVNASAGEFYKQPMFYHLGHFSKFVPRDSIRIEAVSALNIELGLVAFQRPDNSTAVVILNQNEWALTVKVFDASKGTAEVELSEKSITTLIYW